MTAAVATPLSELTGRYELDPAHSRIGFVARHAMVTKVRGEFADFSGVVDFKGADPAASSITVTIEGVSIDTHNEQRDGHLRSNDFLALDEHPQITFTSTAIELEDAETLRVAGDLAIRGVTQPVSIDFEYQGVATDPFGNVRVGFEGSTTINRKDFGIVWNAALETGGVLVSDKIVLEFDISAVKQA